MEQNKKKTEMPSDDIWMFSDSWYCSILVQRGETLPTTAGETEARESSKRMQLMPAVLCPASITDL